MPQNITQDAKYPHITKTTNPETGRITAKCGMCKKPSITYPDKGLGRANYAAWVTHHQH